MMKHLYIGVCVLALLPVAAGAAPIWTDHNDHDPGVTARQQGRIILDSDQATERHGTEDINIGVGELQQHNQTDLDFLRERAAAIRAWAKEHRVKVRFPWIR